VALIYPIITLELPHDQTSTHLQMLGRQPDREMSAAWPIETHVRSHGPPVFLAQARDDPISDIANFRIMAEVGALAGIRPETHTLAPGGHGFGMRRPGTPSAQGPVRYAAWLSTVGVPA
jgi:acetyl esterase/lipase